MILLFFFALSFLLSPFLLLLFHMVVFILILLPFLSSILCLNMFLSLGTLSLSVNPLRTTSLFPLLSIPMSPLYMVRFWVAFLPIDSDQDSGLTSLPGRSRLRLSTDARSDPAVSRLRLSL